VSAANSLAPLWELGELPFHVGPRTQPTNGSLPDRLPFTVGVDERSGGLVQMPDPAVTSALEQAYRQGSQIGTPLSESGSGRRGLHEFLHFVERAGEGEDVDGLSILEIGSGGGAVLRALHARGATVIGVEPGAAGDRDEPFEVLREPFRPELFDAPFDLIIHHGVAEHVPDPVMFMSEQLSLLTAEGAIAFTVPDCTPAIARGDISMLVHEHWSYFTEDTLAAVASLAGARVVHTEHAVAAGARHSVWAPSDTQDQVALSTRAASFPATASSSLERLRERLTELCAGDARLGIYCPGRFINYEALLGASLPPLRYFDDDPLLEGLYYPPSSVQIESRRGLTIDPPSHVVVFSWTFGAEILESLRADPRLDGVNIRTIDDLLSSRGEGAAILEN
jgi:SAM-dependent methyltransferase